MAKVAIVALTRGGCQTALRLGGLLPGADVYLKAGVWGAEPELSSVNYFSEKLAVLIARIYGQYQGFVMIMAAGIVFRTFAPYAVHKSQDPAVVVMDEQAHFAISLLAGHLGGANQLAREVAERWGSPWGAPCQAVITTATDVRQKPAFDLLAQANNCRIANLSELKYISSALVNGGRVALLPCLGVEGEVPPEVVFCKAGDEYSPCPGLVYISPFVPNAKALPQAEHVLHLIPRVLTLGVGCKRGAAPEALQWAAADFLAKGGVEPQALCRIASIDLKKDEPAILALAEHYQTPFVTYTAEELCHAAAKLPGERQSDFVRQTVGTPGVAEPAAMLAAGGTEGRAELLEGKTVYPGVTLSLALDTSWVFKF